MSALTEALRAEHHEMLPRIEQLRLAADQVGRVPLPELEHAVDTACTFLTDTLMPHAAAEEAALYPVVARVMGSPQATATMLRDHAEIARRVTALTELRVRIGFTLDDTTIAELRASLYGLYTLVLVHFVKEEDVYLPLLERALSTTESATVLTELEAAARMAHAHH